MAQSLIELVNRFKTLPCTAAHPASTNDACEFYHSATDHRRPVFSGPDLAYLNILYIPKLVPEDRKENFALNLVEYNYHILNFKTKPCFCLGLSGNCPLGRFCSYTHTDDDLTELNEERRRIVSRKPSSPVESADQKPKKKSPYIVSLSESEEAYIVSTTIEFKEDSEHAFIQLKASKQIEQKLKSINEYLCAFANSNGGTLYLGIRPSGHIDGTICDRPTMDRIRLAIDHARMGIRPTLIQCSQVRLDTKKVVKLVKGKYVPQPEMYVIEVHVRKGVPNETYTLGDERILVREGKENKELGGAELIQHVVEKAKSARKGLVGSLQP